MYIPLRYAHTTPLSAQIAKRYMHKDLCIKTVIPGFVRHLSAQSRLAENFQSRRVGPGRSRLVAAQPNSQAITLWAKLRVASGG